MYANLIEILILVGVALVALLAIGLVLARLYRRSTKEQAFVRTGLGGQKVVMNGGALVLPVFHETIKVNMNTLRLEVRRAETDSLITKDRLRVDVVAAFYVRVKPTEEAIAAAAQTLGIRTLDPGSLKDLVEDKFVDSLRSVAARMTMQGLQDEREQFVQAVQNAVTEDLLKNGLELESVSLTSLDQTSKDFFNPTNAFDAEGLTKLTEETERRRKERNVIEQDTEVSVRQKNLEAEQQKLEIERQQEFLVLQQQQEVEKRRAEQAALVASQAAEKTREAEEAKIVAQQQVDQARITAERQVQESEVEKNRAIKQRQIEADRELEIARITQEKLTTLQDQERAIAIAERSKAQSEAEAQANAARADAVRAEEDVVTTREVAKAERDKAVSLVEAAKEAEQQAIAMKVQAEAEKAAATDRAEAIKIQADAELIAGTAKAEAQRLLNAAINTLSAEQIGLQIKLALIDRMPQIIKESVEPMKAIDGIKIVQVDGLTGRSGSGADGAAGAGGSGNLAEQAVNAALAYRAQQPIIDALLGELGLKSGDAAGLAGALGPASAPNGDAAKAG